MENFAIFQPWPYLSFTLCLVNNAYNGYLRSSIKPKSCCCNHSKPSAMKSFGAIRPRHCLSSESACWSGQLAVHYCVQLSLAQGEVLWELCWDENVSKMTHFDLNIKDRKLFLRPILAVSGNFVHPHPFLPQRMIIKLTKLPSWFDVHRLK